MGRFAVAGAVVLVFAGAAAGAPLEKRAELSPEILLANGARYADPVGDSGTVADISAVSVSNDDEGTIEFQVVLANRPVFTPDDVVQIPIDADGAQYTGHNGFEYLIQVTTNGIGFYADDNGNYAPADAQTDVAFTNGVLSVRLSFRDLSETAFVRFYVAADSITPSPGVYDWAPDGEALYLFDVQIPLLVDEHEAAPRTVQAGKSVSISSTVTTNNAERATIRCAATVAGRRLTGTGVWTPEPLVPPQPPEGVPAASTPYGFKANVTCRFTLPKRTKKHTLRGTMTIVKGGVTVRRTFSIRVV